MTSTPERREQIGAFFAAQATHLHQTVRAGARAPEQVIEDACQTAWTILLRRLDITLDERGLAWLATVAIHDAWRHASITHETPVGSFQGDPIGQEGELPEPAHPDERSAEQRALARIEHAERLQALGTLKPREREALYLKGLGYSYNEIMALSRAGAVIELYLIAFGRRRHVADTPVPATLRLGSGAPSALARPPAVPAAIIA